MKKMILFANLVLMLVPVTLAQDNSALVQRERKQHQEKVALQKAVKDSPTAKALSIKVIAGESNSILEAAATGDQSLIPYLKLLATKEFRSNQESSAVNAHIALVKLGDEQALAEVIAETKDASPFVQDTAIRKLARAGTKKAFRKLYELLDDTAERRPNVPIANDVIIAPNNAVVAMYELAEVVDNPPVKKNLVPSISDIPLWKAWFKKINT
jgi:hypothetical protein